MKLRSHCILLFNALRGHRNICSTKHWCPGSEYLKELLSAYLVCTAICMDELFKVGLVAPFCTKAVSLAYFTFSTEFILLNFMPFIDFFSLFTSILRSVVSYTATT